MEYRTQKVNQHYPCPEELQQHQSTQIEADEKTIEDLSEEELDAVAGGGSIWRKAKTSASNFGSGFLGSMGF